VINVRPLPIRYAYVQLLSDRNEAWDYVEASENPGYYSLFNDDFKAEAGVNYKLRVKLPDETIYESEWETLPTTNVPVMGDITFKEESIQKYGYHLGEPVLETVKGIWTQIVVPDNTTEEPLNYRWTYTAHWEFVAALSSPASRGHRCWVTNPLEVQHYAIQQDRRGGYNKDLYFSETIRNDKIFVRYSSLIVQHAMTEEFYTFWKEMKEQNEGGAILDKPPFNLETNFRSIGVERKVSGYFGVVQEQAKRWYFERSQLSYRVDDPSRTDCAIRYQPNPPPECFSCFLYRFGLSTNVKPEWWED
jgi:hypothetical protein